jgi:hypothetical protein
MGAPDCVAPPRALRDHQAPGLRVTGGLPHGNSCRVSESREFWLLAIHIVVVAADHRHRRRPVEFRGTTTDRGHIIQPPQHRCPYNPALDSARTRFSPPSGPATWGGLSSTRYAAESRFPDQHHFDMK